MEGRYYNSPQYLVFLKQLMESRSYQSERDRVKSCVEAGFLSSKTANAYLNKLSILEAEEKDGQS